MDQQISVDKSQATLWLHLRALPSKLLVGGPSCKVIPVPAILALQLRKALMVDVCGLSSGGCLGDKAEGVQRGGGPMVQATQGTSCLPAAWQGFALRVQI